MTDKMCMQNKEIYTTPARRDLLSRHSPGCFNRQRHFMNSCSTHILVASLIGLLAREVTYAAMLTSQQSVKTQPLLSPAGAAASQSLLSALPASQQPPKQPSNREIEKQIVDRILGEGYDKRIRPAGPGPRNETLGKFWHLMILLFSPRHCVSRILWCLACTTIAN